MESPPFDGVRPHPASEMSIFVEMKPLDYFSKKWQSSGLPSQP
jgi:hypothetical protein